MLSGPYQLTYLRGKLRVRCYLKNGHTEDKYFPCSTMGNNDLQAAKSIEMFFKTKERLDWLSGETWVKSGSVPVGTQTQQYFNAINFDDTKQYVIHKVVKKMYDPEILSVPVVDYKNWGKTKRTYQTIKCLSRSDICRGYYGILIKTCQGDSKICPNSNNQLITSVSNVCLIWFLTSHQ